MSTLVFATFFDGAQSTEQLNSGHLCDRLPTYAREDERFESCQLQRISTRIQILRFEGEELPRKRLECVGHSLSLGLPLFRGIHARCEEAPRLITSVASRLERYLGIPPKANELLAAVQLVLEPPESGARRLQQQI